MRKYKVKMSRINHILISHLHGDHFFGLFGLISSFNLLGRTQDLHIYSPGDLQKIIYTVLKKKELSFEIFFHKLDTNIKTIIYESKSIRINCFPLKHRIDTYGYLLEEKKKDRNIIKEAIEKFNLSIKDILSIKNGNDHIDENGKTIPKNMLSLPPYKKRSYAFCSDTMYFEDIIENIKDIDILYHEATFANDLKETAHLSMHSTSSEAATIAKKANVKKLLIGHFSSRYKDYDMLIKEAKEIFENTVPVNDGDKFKITPVREEE